MTPAYEDGRVVLYQRHVLDVVRELPAASVHCVVTSPPYWGLRDYGLEPQVWGGDPACAHAWGEDLRIHKGGSSSTDTIATSGRAAAAERNKVMDVDAGAFCA